MLLLSRGEGEVLSIGEDITVMVVRVNGTKAVLGVQAPQAFKVLRKEKKNETLEAASHGCNEEE